MEINKKNRTDLKSYFLANNIPTQKDFEDFIDANINQAEDGIAKAQGNPIALQAEGDPGGPQEVLHFYKSFADTNPAWGITLNPRVDPSVPESNHSGLNIRDASGGSRLYIRSAGGEVGIGTIEPTAKLTIQAEEDASMISVKSGSTQLFEVAREGNDGMLSIRQGNGTNVSRVSGNPGKSSFFLSRVGVGTESPEAHLHVKGAGPEIRITNVEAGNPPLLSLHSASGKFWNVTAVDGNLAFAPSGNRDKQMVISEGGGLKIKGSGKINEPDGNMHISNGVILFGGNNVSGKNRHSAQISAGVHQQNSLNIVGMATGASSTDRKIDIWAEGGMTVRGRIKHPSTYVAAFSVSLGADSKGNKTIVTFSQINYNIGNHFKSKNHFVAPVKGVYLFSLTMRNNTDGDVIWLLRRNTTGYVNGSGGSETNERTWVRSRLDNHTASRTVVTVLQAGDKVHVQQIGGGIDNHSSGWDGVLLVAMT